MMRSTQNGPELTINGKNAILLRERERGRGGEEG